MVLSRRTLHTVDLHAARNRLALELQRLNTDCDEDPTSTQLDFKRHDTLIEFEEVCDELARRERAEARYHD